MRFAILGPGKKFIGYSTRRLIEEAQKEFGAVDFIPLIDVKLMIDKTLQIFFRKQNLQDYDYILPRIDSKRAAIGFPIIAFLDDLGVKKPYPAETILLAHNKFLTLERLAHHGITVPKTFLTGSKQSAKEIIDREGTPIIIKLLSGFGGQGVMFMETKETARAAIQTMSTLKQEILLEEYLENPGEDIRGFVVGNEVVAAYKRIAHEGDVRANYHAGGSAKPFTLTKEMEDVVLKSAEVLKADICAIDMIENKGQPYVIEANINPGIELLERTTNVNVAGRVISFVRTQMKH